MTLPIVTFIAIASNLLLGLFTLQKSPKNTTNRLFFLFCLSTIVWAFFNFLSLLPIEITQAVWWIRAHLASATLVAATFLLFIYNFPHIQLVATRKWLYLYLTLILVTIIATLSPYVIQLDTIQETKHLTTEPGVLMPLFAVVSFGSIGAGITILIKKFKKSKGKQRDQYRYMLLGTSLMFALIFFLLFIPVILLKNSFFASYLPITIFPFLAATTYSITRHSLFDLRPVIARSVAFTLLVSILSLAYVGALFGIGQLFFRGQASGLQVFIYTILALFVAITYQPLKDWLEQATDKIFYKTRYSSNDVITDITSIMAETLELDNLAGLSLNKITSVMQISRGSFWVATESGFKCVARQDHDVSLNASTIDAIHDLSQSDHIMVLEEDQDIAHRKALRKLDVSMAIPLFAGDTLQGVIMLGEKKSGDNYSEKDINVLRIIAPSLATAVENARNFKQISEFNLTLESEVEKATKDLKSANDKLIRSNEKLRQLDKLKDEFISVTSHELRTPLTAIRGYIWMAMHGKNKSKGFEQYMARAYVSTERLITLVNDTLDISRIESGRMQLVNEATDMNKLAQEVVDDLQGKANQRQQQLVIKKSRSLPLAECDPVKIYQVLTNLVGNALKFTPEGGRITIDFQHRQDFIHIRVKDTGAGISPEDQQKLFQKFSRLEAAAAFPGTGLGLYLCRQIVKLSGGKIWIESKVGHGASFIFTLPTSSQKAVSTKKLPRQFKSPSS